MGMVLVLGLVFGVVCAAFCAHMAREKGRDPVLWGACGFFFSLIAVIALAGVPAITGPVIGPRRPGGVPAAEQLVDCPHCGAATPAARERCVKCRKPLA